MTTWDEGRDLRFVLRDTYFVLPPSVSSVVGDSGHFRLSNNLSQRSRTIEVPHLLETRGDVMDLNLVVIAGRLAAAPEIRVFDGGQTLVRYLVTTRTEEPRRRIDVVPAVLWDADEDATRFERGDRIWIAGSIQRRFWSDDHSRRSRIEVVAHHVQGGVESTFGQEMPPEASMVEHPAPV